MDRFSVERWRGRRNAFLDVLFLGVLAVFAAAQFSRVWNDHVFTSVPFAINYTILCGLTLIRRRPLESSWKARDWLVAASSWLPLAMQPADTSAVMGAMGASIGVLGAALTCVSILSLGRSFGLVAANRGIRTKGAYSAIRHPLYAAESLAMLGNLIANPGALNGALITVALISIPLRIFVEEQLLATTAEYQSYMRRVRWRLVPGLY